MTDQPVETHLGDVIEISVPASPVYVSLLRTAAAALAARLDFTVDEIDDLRIAVDEACALLLPDARSDATLICRLVLDEAALRVSVTAATKSQQPPGPSSFAWMVLTALATDVSVDTSGDHTLTVNLSKARSTSP